ncbi:MarR family winged helix-turn-helix transcriptional regulator [Caballeronia sp. 15715]|uniref:MarR family winged helix-turn-helix transcriptional regulator n=1 Tax=Caballeronia sp. 15715 TaxID=3391030 RepID=UPI0039E35BF2
MPPIDVLRQSVSSALVIAARQWRRTSQSVIAAYNVSEACATPLLIAARLDEPVRQVALAELTGIEGPSLVRLLDQLCAANLVRRDEDPDDRRAKIISLTDEGRSVTAKIEKELIGLRADVLNDVSREDLEATLRVFAAFKLGASSQTQQAPAHASPLNASPINASHQGPTIGPDRTDTEEGV